MTSRRTLASVGSFVFLGCAAAPPAPVASKPKLAAARHETDSGPKRVLPHADERGSREVAVGRDERFSADHQVAVLRRAITLYQQFIDRAGGDPAFAEAVKRSRDRMKDAEQTIVFLLAETESPER